MQTVYPNLTGEIAKRGIRKTVIAKQIGISDKSLYSKMTGGTSFTLDEAKAINRCFFPDMDLGTLFVKAADAGPGM